MLIDHGNAASMDETESAASEAASSAVQILRATIESSAHQGLSAVQALNARTMLLEFVDGTLAQLKLNATSGVGLLQWIDVKPNWQQLGLVAVPTVMQSILPDSMQSLWCCKSAYAAFNRNMDSMDPVPVMAYERPCSIAEVLHRGTHNPTTDIRDPDDLADQELQGLSQVWRVLF